MNYECTYILIIQELIENLLDKKTHTHDAYNNYFLTTHPHV